MIESSNNGSPYCVYVVEIRLTIAQPTQHTLWTKRKCKHTRPWWERSEFKSLFELTCSAGKKLAQAWIIFHQRLRDRKRTAAKMHMKYNKFYWRIFPPYRLLNAVASLFRVIYKTVILTLLPQTYIALSVCVCVCLCLCGNRFLWR